METEKEIVSLYRYFAWADYMRLLYRQSIKRENAFTRRGEPAEETFCTMSYWYGALYVVVEGWKDELKLHDERIDRLLTKETFVSLLKKYRNATFHYQDEYFHEKFLQVWREGEAAAEWAHDLHRELRRYLEDWIERSGHADKATEIARMAMKSRQGKPLPREYGFNDESEVRETITKERKRESKIKEISYSLSFLVFFVTSGFVLYLYSQYPEVLPDTWTLMGIVRLMFFGTIAAAIGAGIGGIFLMGIRPIAENRLPPSEDSHRAKKYLEAVHEWNREIKEEYGYST